MDANEIQKINDLYKQVDEKDLKIQSLENNLLTAQNTVNFLNQNIESYKEVIDNLSEKVDLIARKLDVKKPAVKK
jgi:peptidoglycan hydrolase CwlO-like protein|tara:strand:+ start:673 stop:897 length:225 start_codon:yes stop_codon:yes gene_type:complete